jgi:adenine-specific DNA-methyltransferase
MFSNSIYSMNNSFEEAFNAVQKLANDFDSGSSYYQKSTYQEAEVRKDFIDPFFIALGWDVNHEVQKNPYKQEVKVERSQTQEGERGKKFADYAFYINPNYKDPVFFVEAKKPAIKLADNKDYYLQTHKYGWNSQTPIAVLTDFEEFIIIDCRSKPHPNYSSNAAVKKYSYKDYLDENSFREIYFLFSHEAVTENSIPHFVETQIPKPTSKTRQLKLFGGAYKAVDDDFLEYIDELRIDLSRTFYKSDPKLTSEQLTEAAQKTIDRLVFMRFLEDKQIEFDDYVYQFKKWKDFINKSKELDGKYNGVVFKESIIDRLDFKGANDGLFFDLCQDISSKESPYNFNAIPIHILGNIYERFLGKIVNIENRKVNIVQKPEVRKAGGVYYTPKYIVDYIVLNSVGTLVKGKTPKEIDNLSFIDISCGSGSFLIGVYEYLIDYHRHYYQEKLEGKTDIDGRSEDFGNVVYQDGSWSITLKRKQEILLNNIFGVDIDNQAVEVTQLSLFLKLLEDETISSTEDVQRTAFSKVLPDLSNNIKCGNSLVGWDILDGHIFEPEEEKHLNPFDYKNAFSKILNKSGFDVVVGNPPYVKEYTDREIFENVKKSYLSKYYQGKMDLWYFFVCNGLDLLKENGMLGYIAPNNWTTNEGASILRNKVIKDSQITEIVDFNNYMVFDDASIQTMILLLRKSKKAKSYKLNYSKFLGLAESKEEVISLLKKEKKENNFLVHPKLKREDYINKYILFTEKGSEDVLSKIKIKQNFVLDAKNEVAQGIVAPQDSINKSSSEILNIPVNTGIFILTDEELKKLGLSKAEFDFIKPLYTTIELNKFYSDSKNKFWIIYTSSKFKQANSLDNYPNLKKHLDTFQTVITSHNKPYGLHRARVEDFFLGEKIISLRKCSGDPIFSYVNFDSYVTQTFNVIKSDRIDLKYLTGILNSTLVKFWLKNRGKMQGSNFQIDKTPLLEIPIHLTKDKNKFERTIQIVDRIIETLEQMKNSMTSKDIEFYKRKYKSHIDLLDRLVYDLYGLSDEDIDVINN